METFFIKAAQLILAFMILVIIHEFGHFLFARMFGVKVEKFYIFFNPWFSICKWTPKKRLNKKGKPGFWRDTTYGIGWLPFGGYCKIAGMIDESMDTEQMKQPPKSWEFRTKPAWQRLLIMIAGVLFNFLLAILIYAGIVWWWGEEYVPFQESKGMIVYSDTAHKYGFRDGDIPLTADGKPVSNPNQHLFDIANADKVTVLREGRDTVLIELPDNFMAVLDQGAKTDSRGISFMEMDVPVVVHSIQNASAERAGLRVGDRIIAVNDTATPGAMKFLPSLKGKAGQTVRITALRTETSGKTDTVVLPIKLDGGSKIGFQLENDLNKLFNTKKVHYNIFAAVPKGISMGSDMLTNYVSSMKQVFTKEGAQSLGGFGTIGSIFPESWDWYAFWNIAAFLSVALAFMNIIPIPGLDGGHVFFLLWEVITRRKPSEKFMERAQIAGMIFLLLLLLYANGMDIVRLFK